MPLCKFKLSAADGQPGRLGWLSWEQNRIYELPDNLTNLLTMRSNERLQHLGVLQRSNVGAYPLRNVLLQPPVDNQEVWAAGVTYEISRDARIEESTDEDAYARVYDAERPELFFKAPGWRCVGPNQPVAIRKDSSWDVPEPELTLVIDAYGVVAGYTIGNDMSSRSIEGENPLYLPQAKSYRQSCGLGPWIVLAEEIEEVSDINIGIVIERDGKTLWGGSTSTRKLRRTFDELIRYLFHSLDFPNGVLLMTGTGLAPPAKFTLQPGDLVTIEIEHIGTLTNPVVEVELRKSYR